MATTADKAHGNTSGAILERFFKPIASKMFGHPVYSLGGIGPSIAVLCPHQEFLNSAFALLMGGKNFSDGCCRPTRMHEVWRALGLSQIIVEQLSILRQEEAMRWSIVVPGKHGMSALMIPLNEA